MSGYGFYIGEAPNPFAGVPAGKFSASSGASIKRYLNNAGIQHALSVDTGDVAAATANVTAAYVPPVDRPWIASIEFKNAYAYSTCGLQQSSDSTGVGKVSFELLNAAGDVLATLDVQGLGLASGGGINFAVTGGDSLGFDTALYWSAAWQWTGIIRFFFRVDPIRKTIRGFAGATHGIGAATGKWESSTPGNLFNRTNAPVGHSWEHPTTGAFVEPDATTELAFTDCGDVVSVRLKCTASDGTTSAYRRVGVLVSQIQADAADRFGGILADSHGEQLTTGIWENIPVGVRILPVVRGGSLAENFFGDQIRWWVSQMGLVLYWLGYNDTSTGYDGSTYAAVVGDQIEEAVSRGHVMMSTIYSTAADAARDSVIQVVNASIKSIASTNSIPLLQIDRAIQRRDLEQPYWGGMLMSPITADYDAVGTLFADDFASNNFTAGGWTTTGAAIAINASSLVEGTYSVTINAAADATQGYAEKVIVYAAGQNLSAGLSVLIDDASIADGRTLDVFRLRSATGNIAGVVVNRTGSALEFRTLDGMKIMGGVLPQVPYRVEIFRTSANILNYRIGFGPPQLTIGTAQTDALASLIIGKYTTAANTRGRLYIDRVWVSGSYPNWADAHAASSGVGANLPSQMIVGAMSAYLHRKPKVIQPVMVI